MKRFIAYQRDHRLWTAQAQDSKEPVLLKFGEWIGWRKVDSIRQEDLQEYYEALRTGKGKGGKTRHERTAQSYLTVTSSPRVLLASLEKHSGPRKD